MSHPPSPSKTKAPPVPNLLFEEARRLRLKKRFSQNFLTNAVVLDRIAELMCMEPGETLVEIGPGAGFLTERLLTKTDKLIAVELDRRMCQYLAAKFPKEKYPQLNLIQHDILSFNFDEVPSPRFKVVGNLPYAITSKIMFLLAGELEQIDYPLRDRIAQLTVMVQKEVAERITATPGQRAYNPLSIALQFWFEPRLDFIVPSNNFYPAPKVESAVITLMPRSQPAAVVNDMILFGRLVRAAFSQKRKTVRNSLIGGSFATPEIIDQVFEATGVSSKLRAEAISVQAFAELSNAFGSNTGQG
jgi:16S rRNA (adenine1518-N6/adenine1519-N6)-dimethyltransferase